MFRFYQPFLNVFLADIIRTGKYFRGPVDCLLHIRKSQGLRCFYKGMLPMALRDIPGYGTYILVYEWTFTKFRNMNFGDRHGFVASVLAGGWAGVVSWALVVPVDVIKSVVQADITKGDYTGFRDCVTRVYRQRGLKAFYAGFFITTLRGLPQGCATFLVYSQVLKLLNKS